MNKINRRSREYFMPVSQSDASQSGTASSTTPVSVQQQFNSQVSSTRNGISVPSNNTTSGQTDYSDRSNQVSNRSKVALVGRYGAGTNNTYGGQTQAANAGAATTFTQVMFDITPQMTEAGSMSLVDIGEIRAPGSIVVYLGSPARTFTINATFVSTTKADADTTFNNISVLKAWRMPTSMMDEPETLRLFAYNKSINGVPCLLTNISIDYPDDVDYILNSNGTPIPIVQKVSIALKEVRNFSDIQKFDYVKFKQGQLEGW